MHNTWIYPRRRPCNITQLLCLHEDIVPLLPTLRKNAILLRKFVFTAGWAIYIGGKYMDGFIDKFAQRKNAQEMIRANAMAEAEEKDRMASRLTEYELAIQEIRRCNLQTLENSEEVKAFLAVSLQKIEEVQKKDEGTERKQEESVQEIKSLLDNLKKDFTEVLERQKNQIPAALKVYGSQMAESLEGLKSRIKEAGEEQKSQMQEILKDQQVLTEEQNTRLWEAMKAQEKSLTELRGNSEDFTHKEAVKVYRNVQASLENLLPKQTEEITEGVKGMLKEKGNSTMMTVLLLLTFIAATANVVIEVLKFLGYL